MITEKIESKFFRFKNFFRIRPKRFLGIDVGASFIRMVELGRKGQIIRLNNYAELKLTEFNNRPFNLPEKNNLSSKEISDAIKALFKQAGMQTKDSAFSIPDFGSFFTKIELPEMDKDEIPQAVKYQVRPYIPLPLDDVSLDWSIIEGQPAKTPIEVLVVAIPNNIIDHYQEIAKCSDLDLKFLEPEVFSLARASIKDGRDNKVIALIDIGAWSTTCSILEKGILKTSHSFNIAGNDLTKVIARSLNIDYNKAEEMKRKYGLLPSKELDDSQNIRKLLIPLVGSILQETKKAFHNYYLEEGKEIEKIVLAGGVSLMPGLKEFFSVELRKPIIIADSFLDIVSPPILADVLKEMGPYYGIALGLALKGLE
jgi:type IV pilus assembly protein PilM